MNIDYKRGASWGSDPEIFVRGGDGEILPSWKFLMSEKDAKQANDRNTESGHRDTIGGGNTGINATLKPHDLVAYTDGFQAEFSFAPQSCLEMVCLRVRRGLMSVLDAALKVDPKAKLTLDSCPEISENTLLTEDQEHVMLGCAPSLNVYGRPAEFPHNPRELKVRFAGGHIHSRPDLFNQLKEAEHLVKFYDKVLGVYMVAAARSFDKPLRRRYYGLAGEHRLPDYGGLEYRTLSNVWLAHPGITHLIFNLTRGLQNAVYYGIDKMFVCGDELAIETIDNCDVKAAQDIVKANEPMFRAMLACGLRGNYTEEAGDAMMRVARGGVEAILKDPSDLFKHWQLGCNFGAEGPTTWHMTSQELSRTPVL